LNLVAAWSLAELYESQGQLRKRGILYEDISQILRPHANIPPVFLAMLHMSKAALFYEWDRLPEALSLVQQALRDFQHQDLSVFPTLGLWIQARIELEQGHSEMACLFLQQQQQSLVQASATEQKDVYSAALSARLLLACGRVEEALSWEHICGLRFDDLHTMPLESRQVFLYLTLARILIARGRMQRTRSALSQALILLDHLRDPVVRVGFHGWCIEILMLMALALQAQGKIKQALTTLGAVLSQAEPEGYVRLFADEGQSMAHLLAQVAAYTSASPSYPQRLLAAISPTQDIMPDLPQEKRYQSLLDPLSVREQEVLRLLAAGFSNQQIADQLVISLHTVKLHVKHILSKLTVTNRTQAVTRARELHLF
jgi:LuxR family maltose regulon positive regulatory protein